MSIPIPRTRRATCIVSVNITSSVAGFIGLFSNAVYSATKAGLIGFAESMRAELKPFDIAVSVVCPPNTRTPGLLKENRTKSAELLALEEKVRVVEPAEVAEESLRQLSANRLLIIPTWDSWGAYLLKRIAPRFVEFRTRRPQNHVFLLKAA